MATRDLLSSVESVRALDRVADVLGRVRLPEAVEAALRGRFLGHPVHPILITLPVGTWTAAAVADFLLHDDDTARKLVGIGLAATPAAVLTGLVELATVTDPRGRRVGALHALSNATAAVCFLASYRARRSGARRAGVTWSVLGLTAVSVGGALGGHLAYALGAGVRRESR